MNVVGHRTAHRKVYLEFDFKYDGLGPSTLTYKQRLRLGRSGIGILKVNWKPVASKTLPRSCR
jgi:hypothetical protein